MMMNFKKSTNTSVITWCIFSAGWSSSWLDTRKDLRSKLGTDADLGKFSGMLFPISILFIDIESSFVVSFAVVLSAEEYNYNHLN